MGTMQQTANGNNINNEITGNSCTKTTPYWYCFKMAQNKNKTITKKTYTKTNNYVHEENESKID